MDPRFFRQYADLITEAEKAPAFQLDEGVAEQLKAMAEKAIAKVKSTPALAPFFNQAQGKQQELLQIFQNAKSIEDIKAQVQQLATQQPVAEGIDVRGSIAGTVLSAITSGVLVVLAKMIGIYQQMGAPDILAGSHMNMVGGATFGIIPPLMAAFLACIYASQVKSGVSFNKEMYPQANPLSGK